MRSRAQGGFTLVEMLVAISVLGVTLAVVAACFGTGLRVRSRSLQHLAFEREARTLLERLRDDFAHVVPGGVTPVVRHDAIVLWRTPGVDAERGPRLVSYAWSVTETADSVLVRVEAPLGADPNDADAVRAEFLDWTEATRASRSAAGDLRRDRGRRVFGDHAQRNGRRGRWTGHPHLHDVAFRLVGAAAGDRHDVTGSRIDVELSGADGRRIETTVWLDVVARGFETLGPSADPEVRP